MSSILRLDRLRQFIGELATLLDSLRESEINQKGKARKLWDIEEGKGI